MGFKIAIEGLQDIKKQLKEIADPSSMHQQLATSILSLHDVLNRKVNTLYNVPYPLNQVRIGHTVPMERIGRTLLRFSLQYRHIPVPLGDYTVSTSDSDSISSAPTRIGGDPLGRVKWKRGKYSTDYKVAIRKGRPTLQGTAGKGAKGSYAFRTNSDYLVRRKRQTWAVRPSYNVRGIRTKLQIMYGPSLSQLASKVYDNDYEVQRAIDKMLTNLGRIL